MNIKNQSKFNKTIGIIILVAAALVGVLLINSIFVKGASSGKTAEKNYIKALYKNQKIEKVLKVSPYDLLKKSDGEEYALKITNHTIKYFDKDKKYDTVNYKREDIKEFDKYDIRDFEEYFLDDFDKKIKVKDGYKVTIVVETSGKYKGKENVEIAVMKIGNRWYAMDYGMFYWETLY